MKDTRASPGKEPAGKRPVGRAPDSDVQAIVAGVHGDPFAVLGVQEVGGAFIARCFIPHAETVQAHTLAGEPIGDLERRHAEGFFEGRLAIDRRQPVKYRASNAGGESTTPFAM